MNKEMKIEDVKILASRRKFIIPLTKEEHKMLKEQINNEGGINTPIDIDQNGYLLDGHNRHGIVKAMGSATIPYKTHNILSEKQAEQFMIERAVGRRNLTNTESAKLMRLYYESIKSSKGGQKGNKNAKGAAAAEPAEKNSAKEKTAKAFGVTPGKVKAALNKTKPSGEPKEKKSTPILDEAYKEAARAMTALRARYHAVTDAEFREWVIAKLEQIIEEADKGTMKQMSPSEIQNS